MSARPLEITKGTRRNDAAHFEDTDHLATNLKPELPAQRGLEARLTGRASIIFPAESLQSDAVRLPSPKSAWLRLRGRLNAKNLGHTALQAIRTNQATGKAAMAPQGNHVTQPAGFALTGLQPGQSALWESRRLRPAAPGSCSGGCEPCSGAGPRHGRLTLWVVPARVVSRFASRAWRLGRLVGNRPSPQLDQSSVRYCAQSRPSRCCASRAQYTRIAADAGFICSRVRCGFMISWTTGRGSARERSSSSPAGVR